MKRPDIRTLLAFTHDLGAIALAWFLAFWLRFNLDIPAPFWAAMGHMLLWVLPLQAAIFVTFGLYRGIWRYASLPDLKRIVLAVGVASLCVPVLHVMFRAADPLPRSVLLLHPILLILIMGGSRLMYRAWKEHRLYGVLGTQGSPVVVLGAGEAAVRLVRELARSPEWRVVGLLDDDPAKLGRLLHGVKVVGPISDLARQAAALEAHHAIVAMPSASSAQRRRAIESASVAGLSLLTVPQIDDLLSGKVAISQVRKVELEDLLGRERVELDDAGLHGLLSGKTIMVTGAGGSIGSELCRQIARYAPGLLVFYELSEYALYAIEQEFARRAMPCRFVCVVGDVKDAARLAAVMDQYRPAVVFHAAAYKHVPLMENENAWEAVRNNVLGTLRVARAARTAGVGEFVLISTDKAVNPTNVMGASKRLAEMACQALQTGNTDTRFVMVRFGNVLGSSGSVIPKFRDQIARGGPVTVTHPDIIRYFMLIPEAAQLVLQAGLMASTDEEGGEIFVLDMGEPVRIADLARDMIRLSGFTEEDICIEFTGLRPGEKLYEELLADNEQTVATPHAKLRVAKPTAALAADWLPELESWLAVPLRDETTVKADLKRWVPEYRPAAH